MTIELELVTEGKGKDRIVAGMVMRGTRVGEDEADGGWDRRLFIDTTEDDRGRLYWITIHDDETDDESAVRTTPEEVLALGQAMTEWAETEIAARRRLGVERQLTEPKDFPKVRRLDTGRLKKRGIR